MVTSFHPVKWTAALMLIAMSMVGFTFGADVDAQLDRDSVQAGNGAQLTLRISGGRAGQPEIPKVENLIVQPQGQSQQTQWINGVTTVSVTYNYLVGSNTPGDYQIPAIEIMVDGKKFTTQPLKLKVLADAAAQAPPGIPNPSGTPATQQDTTPSEDQFGFLTVEPATSDRKHVYVGEIAPVRIRAWIPAEARAQLRSGIQPEGKAFTLHHVSDQPQQTQEMKDGKRYLVVTWFGGISATKAGTYPASLSLQANVAVKDESAPAPRRRRGGPFDDPFFDSAFDRMNTRYIQKDVTLTSRDQEIEVRPLPAEGKPTGFTGAVGQFKLGATSIPSEWQTGDPQQVTASVSGEGNFALMKAPALTPEENWKSYQAKDEFTPGDQASFSGTKNFQFSAVPRKGGAQNVGLSFSYFDPTDAQYKTLTSPAKKIQVTGADLVEAKKETNAEPPKEAKKPADNLIAQKSANTASGSLVPLVSQPAFSSWLGLGGGLIALGRLLAFFRERVNDPKRLAHAAMEKAIRDALHAAGECLAANDAAGFFAAARLAIQQRLGSIWNQPAQAITLAEITERIPTDSPVAEFFREADHYEYSRHAAAGEMFPRWQQMLNQALSSLTPSAR
ncbi:MAG: BatD family protein [Luteolibacter sp.]